MTDDSLFMDEIHQVSHYQLPLTRVHEGAARQQQPPLDYWIGALVSRVSYTDFAVRTPAALFGVLGTALVFTLLLAAQVKPVPALGMGLIAAFLPYAVYVSQDARPYAVSIALLLLFLAQLKRVVDRDSDGATGHFLLGLVCFSFLLSRTLVPLLTVACVMAYLLLRAIVLGRRHGAAGLRRGAAPCLPLGLAIVFYLPFLHTILSSGQRYLREDQSLWPASLDFMDLFRAWQAQLEPIALATGVLALIAIARVGYRWRTEPFLPRILVWLAVVLPVVHYLAFRSQTDLPFRPPYAIYVLPIGLLLAGYGLAAIAEALFQRRKGLGTSLAVLIILAMFSSTLLAFTDHRQRELKTDWRGLTAYARNELPAGTLLVAETIAAVPHWDPGHYGAQRYPYPTDLKPVPVDRMAYYREAIRPLEVPVAVVLFQYRDYLLTSASTIPLFAAPRPRAEIALENLDPAIAVERLTGLVVLRPTASSGETALDLYRLIQGVLAILPDDSSRVALELASVYLLEDGKPALMRTHLDRASALARPDQAAAIREVDLFVEQQALRDVGY
ncbi:MAG: glycosyltransferase family 39 protein [Xanthomonadales bacterium]|nr:glycosyltransferase family 39 protein [Xanthomonadales bacterium]